VIDSDNQAAATKRNSSRECTTSLNGCSDLCSLAQQDRAKENCLLTCRGIRDKTGQPSYPKEEGPGSLSIRLCAVRLGVQTRAVLSVTKKHTGIHHKSAFCPRGMWILCRATQYQTTQDEGEPATGGGQMCTYIIGHTASLAQPDQRGRAGKDRTGEIEMTRHIPSRVRRLGRLGRLGRPSAGTDP
jgi:hypothetical protein